MPAAANVIATLHLILQVGFLGVTFLLLVVMVANRLRVRRVRMAWRRGPLFGLPAWPSAFLAAVLVFAAGVFLAGHPVPMTLLAGYLIGGAFWFGAGWLAASVLVTEYGLVLQARCDDRAVAWEQIVDYFEAGPHVVFFYRDAAGRRRRIELPVPKRCRTAFRRLVREKLDARFERTAQQVYGKKTLEG
ncbi:MAG: hypothetical protein R3247_16250 [Rhodothermales bacterium]|nr:hypothetical protein [Rhodothermales bacterium]